MNHELIKFFSIQRQIFGVCNCCGDIFRLSDANVYLKKKPTPDWMDKYEAAEARIDRAEEKIDDQEAEVREKAREKGRLEALKAAVTPLTTEYLYFVANGTGYHTFTKSILEHNKAKNEYKRKRKKKS